MTNSVNIHRDLIDAVQADLGRLLRAPVLLREWSGRDQLPPYLRAEYAFFEGAVRETQVLWMLRTDAAPTPKTLERHVDALHRWWDGPVVAVFAEISAVTRHRLVERGVAFVVPGVQTFLPDLGFESRERARRVAERRDVLRPSAQATLLYLLRADRGTVQTATGLASTLGYSLMTATRALEELRAAGLVVLERRGRPSLYRLAASTKETWEAAQGGLRSPVLRRQNAVIAHQDLPLAGLSALALQTMLASPRIEVRAVGVVRARELAATQLGSEERDAPDESEQQLEVWSYDPRVLSDGPTVDPLSLYLSLRDDTDERVQAALAQMLEDFEW